MLIRAVVVTLVVTLMTLVPGGAAQAAATKTTCEKFDRGNIKACISVRKVRGKMVAFGYVRKLDGRSNYREANVYLKRKRCPGGEEQTKRFREDVARGDATARARTRKVDYEPRFFYRGVIVSYYARYVPNPDGSTSVYNQGQDVFGTGALGGTACQ